MVLYADILFALNALMDYLLLLLSARAAGAPLRRKRFFLGAVLGGVYAVAIFLPGFSFLERGWWKGLAGGLMLLVAYGWGRGLVKQSLIFLALTFALGGGVLAIGMMDGAALALGRGVVYAIPDVKIILLSGAGCYGLLTLVAPRLCRHTAVGGEIREVRLRLGERTLTLPALVDTGNTLTDPLTGQGVPVAEGAALLPLFPPGRRPTPEELRDPASALARLSGGEWTGRFRLLPYRAVGVERGMLLAVKADSLSDKTGERTGVLVALSPTPVSDGGGYRVLMGGG